MSTETPAAPLGAPSSKNPPTGQPPAPPRHLPEDVVVDHILTRVPAAAAVRFQVVCRAWRDALTSDYFTEAHRAARAAAAADTPEIVFFAAAAASHPYAPPPPRTTFYACKLNLNLPAANNKAEAAAAAAARAPAARELVTVANLCAVELVMSGNRPCRGLTLLHSGPDASSYHVINLSTGEHASLPPCTPPPWLSSAGLGFDPAAREHKVVRLYAAGDGGELRCEVYGLRSGGGRWRPCAGEVPPRAARMRPAGGGRPPVFVGGCFYWQVEWPGYGYPYKQEAILSLAVGTEEFALVAPPGLRPVRRVRRLAELDGALCATVEVDARLRGAAALRERELWTRAAAAGSWSPRCRVDVRWMRGAGGDSLLPLGSSSGGKILLATGAHEVYACDLESGSLEKVFSMEEFGVGYRGEPPGVINISLHEESVTGVRRRPVAGDGGTG